DFQFFPKQIHELYDKEMLYYRRMIKFRVSKDYIKQKYGKEDEDDDQSESDYIGEDSSSDDLENDNLEDEKDDDNIKEQNAINNAEEFTKEDKILKEQLIFQAFTNWSRRDFSLLMQLVTKLGRSNYKEISSKLQNKSEEEVETYLEVFFKKFKEVENYKKIMSKIEEQENKRLEKQKKYDTFKQFVASFVDNNPLITMNIPYLPNTSRKTYSEIEDRFLLLKVYEHGGIPESPKMNKYLKNAVMTCPLFELDWFIRTRSDSELGRRVATLLQVIQRQ
ncbi:slide-domain-containing protein, partial [Hanseniaspora valbyensis NRRL Y-1626]